MMPPAPLQPTDETPRLQLIDILEDMAAHLDAPRPELLVLLVSRLRPAHARDGNDIHWRLAQLCDLLEQQPALATVLSNYVLGLLGQYHQVSLYADTGIVGNENFFTALTQRLGWRLLPPLRQEGYLRDLVQLCFDHRHDDRWIGAIDESDWQRLFGLLAAADIDPRLLHEARSRLLSALMIVSYRITAIGLEPELVQAYPQINEFRSPFLVQNREIIDYVEAFKQRHAVDDEASDAPSAALPDEKQALVMLDQCRDILGRVKRGTRKNGVSISLTNLLNRLEQSLARIELLFGLLHDDTAQVHAALAALLRLITDAQARHGSVREVISINTELLSRQVTENASRMGEHYVSTDHAGFWQMYRSAAGAGLIIASMATIKVLMGRLTLAPLGKAFFYSMNYSFGFMLIHVLRFTVATKQPAMTAAALAATVQQVSGSRQAQLAELAELIVNIMRTQFIAIMGNISVAMPTAFVLTTLWQRTHDAPLLNPAEATELLAGINPFESAALFYAAIAGVWLFVAGLIAGYYDNLATYHQIGERLRQHPALQRRLGEARLDRVAHYIENNLGALAGNFWFGVFLGSTGVVGYIIGVSIDIRHIAFASANFIQGLLCLGRTPEPWLVLVSFLGVLGIGLMNLMVSFGLALFVALRARRVRFAQWGSLMRLIATHFATRPLDFFWPPRQPVPVPEPMKAVETPASDSDSGTKSSRL